MFFIPQDCDITYMNDAVYTLSDNYKEFAQNSRQSRVSSTKETSSVVECLQILLLSIFTTGLIPIHLTRIRCVTDLIQRIDTHTKNAFKGTPFEDDYYWAHDTLSQMCDDS